VAGRADVTILAGEQQTTTGLTVTIRPGP